ncbi:ElyC/SanA/YdcF family protein [Mariniphaga sediminis]|uniref:ElyC/SanA/YdcF family protein n=1 Tax=Mariniphaga sediminis TaxID=1628158 RepID=UPI00356902B0
MRLFFSGLLRLFPLFWLAMCFLVLTDLRLQKRRSRIILYTALGLLLTASTRFVPNWLVGEMENRYPVFQLNQLKATQKEVHILVLGGGHTFDERLPANAQLSGNALERLAEGIRLHRLLPESLLITSGAGAKNEPSQAEILRNAALLLGVDSARIQMQTKPVNTWMEAQEYKRLYGSDAQLILVSSALHMPRAMYLFRKMGLSPIATPTNYRVKKGTQSAFRVALPSENNVEKISALMHEVTGIVWAWIAY